MAIARSVLKWAAGFTGFHADEKTSRRECCHYRPDARMEALKDSHAYFRRKLDGLTACNCDELRSGTESESCSNLTVV
jgi:hypothetical protein